MNANRFSAAIVLTILFAGGASAQKAESWMELKSGDGEFAAITLADSLIVNEDKRYTRVMFSSSDLRLEIGRRPNLPGRRYSVGKPSEDTKLFEVGNARGQLTLREASGRHTLSVRAVSSDYTYDLNASGPVNDRRLIRFMRSIRFDDKPLLTIPGVDAPTQVAALDMKQLKSSNIVKEYLKKPVNKNVVVEYGKIKYAARTPVVKVSEDDVARDDIADTAAPKEVVTRDLVMLSMPKAAYTTAARRDGVNGTVSVKVQLRADGMVGAITADGSLNLSLAESCVEAAKNIKFIPKEVNGKPVDVIRVFVYSFSIY